MPSTHRDFAGFTASGVEKHFEKVEELVEHEKPTLAGPEKALKDLLEESAGSA